MPVKGVNHRRAGDFKADSASFSDFCPDSGYVGTSLSCKSEKATPIADFSLGSTARYSFPMLNLESLKEVANTPFR